MSKFFKIALFNLIVCVVIFALFEILARVFLQPNMPFEQRMENDRLRQSTNLQYIPSAYSRMQMAGSQKILKLDKNNAIAPDSLLYKINSSGYRGEDFDLQKAPGEIRIAIAGGSHVFDPFCLDYNGCPGFPKITENLLRAEGYNVRVLNCGVPGANTLDILMRMHLDILNFHPDYVVINSTWNDSKWLSSLKSPFELLRTPPSATSVNPLAAKVSLWDDLLGWSVIYRKARDFYWRKKLGVDEEGITEVRATEERKKVRERIMNSETENQEIRDFEASLKIYASNLRLLIYQIQQAGAIPILAIEESLIHEANTADEKKVIRYDFTDVNSHKELAFIFRRCNEIIRELAEEKNLQLIHMDDSIKSLEYFEDEIHTNKKGSSAIAGFYASFFSKLLSLRTPPSALSDSASVRFRF